MCPVVRAVKGCVSCCKSSEGLCVLFLATVKVVCPVVRAVKGCVSCCKSSEGLCVLFWQQ